LASRIAVIGGGIIGCLVAREVLAALPSAKLTLIERDLVGAGASQRSAGVHFPLGGTDRVRAMSVTSQAYYDDLKARFPALPIYPLALDAAAPAGVAPALRSRFVDPGPLQAMDPAAGPSISWPGGGATWRVPGCRVAEVGDLVRSLAFELRDRAEVLEGVRVRAIAERPHGVSLELSTGETCEIEKVVLAPGPWVNAREWREHTAGLGVRVKKVVALHIDHPLQDGDVGVLFPEEDAFLVPLAHRGHWLFSYTCLEWDVLPDELHDGVSEGNLADARAALGRYSPELAGRIRSGRVFCDAYSPAREPLVIAVGGAGNVVFAGAANGSGYRLAPAIAAEAVRLLAVHQ
jgi:D-arginine dehydrogenase